MRDADALSPVECRSLLGRRGVGRAVYTERALPAVATLGYAVVGDQLFFRAGAGTGLARAVDDAVIAFNVDEFRCDPHSGLGQGWNVTASGRCRRCAEPAGLSELLLTWAPGPGVDELFRLDLAHLVGRRFRNAAADPRVTSGPWSIDDSEGRDCGSRRSPWER